ncbi:MAG: hypothetical protein R3E83_06750 [Burkholderiaceae bacterium]
MNAIEHRRQRRGQLTRPQAGHQGIEIDQQGSPVTGGSERISQLAGKWRRLCHDEAAPVLD